MPARIIRLFRNLFRFRSNPDAPAAPTAMSFQCRRLLEHAAASRSLVRLKPGGRGVKPVYFIFEVFNAHGLVLRNTRPDRSLNPALFEHALTFRMIAPNPPLGDPALFSFTAQIAEIHPNGETIRLNPPEVVDRIERRGALRLALKTGHTPALLLALGVSEAKRSPSGLFGAPLLHLRSDDEHAKDRLLNLSAGGARLAVPLESAERATSPILCGTELALYIHFAASAVHDELDLTLACAVRNIRHRPDFGLVELGLAFTAYSHSPDLSDLRSVDEHGVPALARVVQARQREYYLEIKEKMELVARSRTESLRESAA